MLRPTKLAWQHGLDSSFAGLRRDHGRQGQLAPVSPGKTAGPPGSSMHGMVEFTSSGEVDCALWFFVITGATRKTRKRGGLCAPQRRLDGL